ncbi:hypothetical protein Gohar_013171 [Gossypium harknessii]|uniref:Uncharacterized protein n=1 Tax=Gossypium harknessii TaxID=34285 RepID=A0A7J9GZ79_9ROSI|nr:hypothetical protein [Gossypium harknessii]
MIYFLKTPFLVLVALYSVLLMFLLSNCRSESHGRGLGKTTTSSKTDYKPKRSNIFTSVQKKI